MMTSSDAGMTSVMLGLRAHFGVDDGSSANAVISPLATTAPSSLISNILEPWCVSTLNLTRSVI